MSLFRNQTWKAIARGRTSSSENSGARRLMEGQVEGFRRFREEAFPAREDLFHKLAHAQSPHTKRHASARGCGATDSSTDHRVNSGRLSKSRSDAAEGRSPPQQVRPTETG